MRRQSVDVVLGADHRDHVGRRRRALAGADALLIAPGSPYRNMDGALSAITYARTRDVPLLGTCGGFQHIVVEYARNVLGVARRGARRVQP